MEDLYLRSISSTYPSHTHSAAGWSQHPVTSLILASFKSKAKQSQRTEKTLPYFPQVAQTEPTEKYSLELVGGVLTLLNQLRENISHRVKPKPVRKLWGDQQG